MCRGPWRAACPGYGCDQPKRCGVPPVRRRSGSRPRCGGMGPSGPGPRSAARAKERIGIGQHLRIEELVQAQPRRRRAAGELGRSTETRMRGSGHVTTWRRRSTSAESAATVGASNRLRSAISTPNDWRRRRDELGAEQRVPAQHEEVVVHVRSRPDGAARPAISAIRCSVSLPAGPRLSSCRVSADSGRGRRGPVDFAIRRERQPVEADEGGWNHVFGEGAAKELAETPIGPAPRPAPSPRRRPAASRRHPPAPRRRFPPRRGAG